MQRQRIALSGEDGIECEIALHAANMVVDSLKPLPMYDYETARRSARYLVAPVRPIALHARGPPEVMKFTMPARDLEKTGSALNLHICQFDHQELSDVSSLRLIRNRNSGLADVVLQANGCWYRATDSRVRRLRIITC